MSRTPICDRWEYESYSSGLVVPLNVAKELESELANKDRQLTEAQAEIENLKWHINSEKAKAEAVLELNSKALKLVNEARAEIERKDKLIEQMREALQWYKEQVSSCNRNGDVGELARDRLAKDVGKRAEAALAAERGE
jgi:peptidoglycan hydrolase CwlO-like protein